MRGARLEGGARVALQPAAGAAAGGSPSSASPCDLVLRHYKTDWWGERLPIWADEDPYADSEPLHGPLQALLAAAAAGRCAVVNPFGSVLAQNKRPIAFLWERLDQLSPDARAAVEAHVPRSVRLEAADRRQLEAEQADWVLKSDYGCEGEEVILGRGGRSGENGGPASSWPCPAAGSPSATSRPGAAPTTRWSTTASIWWRAGARASTRAARAGRPTRGRSRSRWSWCHDRVAAR